MGGLALVRIRPVLVPELGSGEGGGVSWWWGMGDNDMVARDCAIYLWGRILLGLN